MACVFFFAWKEVISLNKKFLKHYMETNPEGTAQTYIFLVENVQFFVVGITPYYYEHGVFMEDHDGVRMKYRIQKLIYRDQVQIYIKGQWPFDTLIILLIIKRVNKRKKVADKL